MDTADLIRTHVRTMEPYTPIFPFEVLAERLGRDPIDIVKLDANENPYGPPQAVRDALAQLDYAHIYPDPESRSLRAALADFTGVPATNLLAGAGADEMIDLTMRLFLNPGDRIINCPPTFGMYPFDAAIAGARVVSVPRGPDFGLDIDAIEQAVAEHQPKLVFVTSPNNPDGSVLPDEHLHHLLRLPLVVVLDEAYVEFAGPNASRIARVPERKNLIVLRSFSKWAGLAGIRIGYGAFPEVLMPHLWKIKQPYNVSVAASQAALAALSDPVYLPRHVARIAAERHRLHQVLSERSFLDPYRSRANFILCRVVGRDAGALKRELERHGILIRYFDKPGLRDHVRFSVGRPEDTERLADALRRI